MASVNDNLNLTSPRVPSTGRPVGPTQPSGLPQPLTSPVVAPHRPDVRQDEALIAARPQTEAEQMSAVLQAVRAAQGKDPDVAPVSKATDKAEAQETRQGKAIADAVGLADGVREGVRLATSADDLARLPVVGKAVQAGTRTGRVLTALAESKAGQAIANAMSQNKVLAPAARFLGRIAPVAGVAVAGYDLYDATKTNQDPKASTTEKVLASTKAALSSVAGAAGVATLALAPTGVGAAIAGVVALGAGLLSLGVDLWLGQVRKDRKGS